MRALSTIFAATLVAGATGCGAFQSKKAVAPTPAASPLETKSRLPSVVPLSLARTDDYVVRVVSGDVTCSGTLIEEDLVLTAHHCVSQRNDFGDMIGRDVKPATITVELGGDYFAWGEVGVRALVTPPCGHAAGHGDIAVLVLERRLVGIPTLAPRLDNAPREREEIHPVGFGRCAMSDGGVKRKQREGGFIQAVYDSRFNAHAAICPGDSGGPVVSDGELIGVISQSVMDGSESTRGRSEFTRLDRWRSVFANARLIANGATRAELPPLACDG